MDMARLSSLRFLLSASSLARSSVICDLTSSSMPNILAMRRPAMLSEMRLTRASEASVNFFCVPCWIMVSLAGSGVVRTGGARVTQGC